MRFIFPWMATTLGIILGGVLLKIDVDALPFAQYLAGWAVAGFGFIISVEYLNWNKKP